MILMLHRYTTHVRGNTAFTSNVINRFTDSGRILSSAGNAMNWGVTHELIKGDNNMLVPNSHITRAQAVLILYRFHKAMLA
jgi:hypothetical protein